MRQWSVDPVAAVCKKVAPFFQVTGRNDFQEKKDAWGTRINSYSLGGE